MQKFNLVYPGEVCFTGDIIIADPQHFLPKLTWQEFNNVLEIEESIVANGVIEFDSKIKILFTTTAYGEGEYGFYMQRGNGESIHNDNIRIESGIIAIALVDDIQKLNPKFNIDDDKYPRVNNFDGCIEADGEGNFVGDLEVNTESEYEGDYDDDDDDDDLYDY